MKYLSIGLFLLITSCNQTSNKTSVNVIETDTQKEILSVNPEPNTYTFVKMENGRITGDPIKVVNRYKNDTIFRHAIHNDKKVPLLTLIKNGDDTYIIQPKRQIPSKAYQKDLLYTYYWDRIKSGKSKIDRDGMTNNWGLRTWNTSWNLYILNDNVIYEHWTAFTVNRPFHEQYHWFTESGEIVMETIYTTENSDLESNGYYRLDIAQQIERFGLKKYHD